MATRIDVQIFYFIVPLHEFTLLYCCVNPFCVFQSGVLNYGQL